MRVTYSRLTACICPWASWTGIPPPQTYATVPCTVPDCNGGSSVFDGVAYLPHLPGSRDTCLLQAGEEEGVYLAVLDLAQLKAYREREIHGNAFRRPQKYGLLVEGGVRPPFVREGYRP